MISVADLDKTRASRGAGLADLQSTQEALHELPMVQRIEDLHVAEAHLTALVARLTSEKKKLADLSVVFSYSQSLIAMPIPIRLLRAL